MPQLPEPQRSPGPPEDRAMGTEELSLRDLVPETSYDLVEAHNDKISHAGQPTIRFKSSVKIFFSGW